MVAPGFAAVEQDREFPDDIVERQQHPLVRLPRGQFKLSPIDRRHGEIEVAAVSPKRFRNQHLLHRVLLSGLKFPDLIRVFGEADRAIPDAGERKPAQVRQVRV